MEILTKTPTGVWDDKLSLTTQKEAVITTSHDSFSQKDNYLQIQIDTQPENPIHIRYENEEFTHKKIEVIIRQGITATIIEEIPHNHTNKLSFYICESATLNYIRMQKGTYIGETTAKVCGTLNYTEINKGSARSTMDVIVEENGVFTSKNIMIGKKGDALHIRPNVKHRKNSTSILEAKAILDEAVAIYDGIVHIPIDASQSVAHQRVDAILLTKNSEMRESPQLFIDNKDVICSHAATSTNMNYEQIFYLQSRGIPFDKAQQLMIQAAIWPLIQNQELLSQILEE